MRVVNCSCLRRRHRSLDQSRQLLGLERRELGRGGRRDWE